MKTVEEILPGIIEFRHALHRIPELAGKEFETSALIRERLSGLSVELLDPFLGTDAVALLRGGRGAGKNVTLRADIDALALSEATGVAYASEHAGRMHACGHDGHTAMVMGAAEILASRRDEFAGSVRFVFQPGEENAAMGRDLVAAGALENPTADFVTALHGMPGLPVGMLALRDGAMMGSCAHFKVMLTGQGGHSSRPHLARNPVTAAAAIVSELEGMTSRLVSAQRPAVLTICRIAGGELANVIPDTAVIEGTARSLSPESDEILERGFRETVEAVAKLRGVKAEIEYRLAYPVTLNAPGPAELARRVIREAGMAYTELPESSLGAEDFAWYCRRYPCVYAKVGTGEECPALHNSKFDFPDAALSAGIRYLVNFALAALA